MNFKLIELNWLTQKLLKEGYADAFLVIFQIWLINVADMCSTNKHKGNREVIG